VARGFGFHDDRRVHDNAIDHFSISNPTGDGQGFVPSLLRRMADAIEGEGDVDVQDLTFQSVVTEGEDDLTMTVYFYRQPRRR
jgi:hypothetical protein